jgi:hypothetical protein
MSKQLKLPKKVKLPKDAFNPNSESYRYGVLAVIETMMIGMSLENQNLFIVGIVQMIAKRQMFMKSLKSSPDVEIIPQYLDR